MRWARNLGIGAKLNIGYFFLVFCTALVSFVSFYGMKGIQQNLHQIFRVNLPGIDYLIEADRDLQQLLVAERSMLMTKPGTDIFKKLENDYEENLQQSEDRWNKYKAIAATPEEKLLIPKYEQAREEWKVISRSAVDQAISGSEIDKVKAIDLSLTTAKEKFEKMRGVIDDLTDIVLRVAQDEDHEAGNIYRRTLSVFSALSCLALLAGVILVVGVSRTIVGPISRVVEGLGSGANQLASASVLISSASQQLAEGASEQAAAIEETSSSLEEMAAMTKQNAENASQANQLMTEASQVVGRANESMGSLTSSMADISRASEETQKIIKTIDEIAFQTNLLALNAAVEAARAGEAGAGFAVVADEVRNLALRAADAAKNTANLIEGTVKKVKEGSDLVGRTNEEFRQVASTVTKSGELVGEIAAASSEQAQGIEQVNKAVSDMDKVTQQNAANAEESASASEEMNTQAEQMREFVANLVALVGGNGKENGKKRQSSSVGKDLVKVALVTPTPRNALTYSGKSNWKGTELTVSKRGGKEVRPEQVIPFDDAGFKDF